MLIPCIKQMDIQYAREYVISEYRYSHLVYPGHVNIAHWTYAFVQAQNERLSSSYHISEPILPLQMSNTNIQTYICIFTSPYQLDTQGY